MHEVDYKTILSPQNGMNLYRGCTHGCIYCDSRSRCYQMQHDFEDIEVKRNAPQILKAQLAHKRNRGMIFTGAMCDPYIHLENELQVMRQCLQVIAQYEFGVAVLTKSDRILRDLDLLTQINQTARCVVQMTLTTYDEDLCRVLEPNVSSTVQRFEVLKTMQQAEIPTVVWLCPLLPFLNDTPENLRGLLDYCVRAKVKAIRMFGFGLTLREGNREYFYKKLDKHFPGMKQQYQKAFGNQYECASTNSAVLWDIFKTECEKHGILYRQKEVETFLNQFETKEKQLSFFD